jgi:hypothetical protein
MVQHIIGGITGMVSVLTSRTEDCGFEPWSNTSSVVLQVWLACSPPEQMIVGSSHGPTHHRWCYREPTIFCSRCEHANHTCNTTDDALDHGSNPQSTVLEASTLTIPVTPPMMCWTRARTHNHLFWLACSPPEQMMVGSSHGPTHHRWCYRYG